METGDPALKINSGGEGPLSAEWMTPKALWIHDEEPDVWENAKHICEYQDFLNYRLTGRMVASACNAATRWHWNGETCVLGPTEGRPISLYEKLGIPELAEKLPHECLSMGSVIGPLTDKAASDLGLPLGLPVVQGGPDAFVGMVGLACVNPGQLCLITGSSHLHCVVSGKATTAPGTWGAYPGAPLPGLHFAEGGQSSTGSLLRWAKQLFGAHDLPYPSLDMEAEAVPPGSDGLVALETFQGSRTPVTDPLARGALVGLTLSHTRAHIWRALMEGVCFGTKACIEGLESAGHPCDEIIIAGGSTRSPLWLQMHADVTGKPVVVCEYTDAPLLGCAVLASVGVGIHSSVKDAVQSMVRVSRRIDPDPSGAKTYQMLYREVYSSLAGSVRGVAHASAAAMSVRGGAEVWKTPVISPSLLASDWSDIRGEVKKCVLAGTSRLHVDVFDGVFLDSPNALTFGPQMVAAIRRSCDRASPSQRVILDLHICVDRPGRYVIPMADAGGDCFIFQWEALKDPGDVVDLAHHIVSSGMLCGISLNPETDVDELIPVLESGLVAVVDVLAVEPGFGGQIFQSSVLSKIAELKRLREAGSLTFDILVDGGIDGETCSVCTEAGADILVSGSYLFKHPQGLAHGVRELSRHRQPTQQ